MVLGDHTKCYQADLILVCIQTLLWRRTKELLRFPENKITEQYIHMWNEICQYDLQSFLSMVNSLVNTWKNNF
jgi:hypothetical protein